MTLAQRFAIWTATLREARVRRVWISTPAFDTILDALMKAAPMNNFHIEAGRYWDGVHAFRFNNIHVLRREARYHEPRLHSAVGSEAVDQR